jgi:hypothetical protein
MTKILVWNIENFGINKFSNPSGRRGAGVGGMTLQQASHFRRNVFINVVNASNPDIIIVVEVSSGDTWPNDLASLTGGMAGCIDLLAALQGALPAWRLVPPMRIGQGGKAESVGVFFRATSTVAGQVINRFFTGPNRWTGGYIGNSVNVGAGAAYPVAAGGNPDINAMLVPAGTVARQIPAGSLYNGNVMEDRVAARTRFSLWDQPTDGAVGGINYGVFREPYMVSFAEQNAATGVIRNLTLFAVHSPAAVGNPAVFITYLANTYEIMRANVGTETRVVCGDFNVNLLDAAGADAQVYNDMTGYQVLLSPPIGPPPPNLDWYRGYFATHIKRSERTSASRFLWSDGVNASAYPGYGYYGSKFVQNFFSVDNILVRPAPAAPNTTVLNPVVGTPYTAGGVAPPVGVPAGTVAMAHSFTNVAPGWPATPNGAPYAAGLAANLRSWANYGYIRSTSDHFALHAEV